MSNADNKQISRTLKCLNMTGTIDGTSTTHLAATSGAIPFDTVGTYQLINQMISDLSSIKATIKTNEKNLISDLSTDNDGVVTVTLGRATHEAQKDELRTRADLLDHANSTVTTHKPAIFKSDDIYYSEDGLFGLLSGLSYEIMKLKNGHTGANMANDSASSAGNAGEQPVPISIEAVG